MKKTLAFIDVETTGLNSCLHEIIEISILRVSPDGKEDLYTTKIRPERLKHADEEALKINGYDTDKWQDAPSADLVFPRISEMLKNCILVGHNVRFDEEFIAESLHRYGITTKYYRRQIDTVTLAYEHLTHLKSLSLDEIRSFFDWSTIGTHRAERDAIDCRRLYLKLYRANAIKRLWWRFAAKLRPILRKLLRLTRG